MQILYYDIVEDWEKRFSHVCYHNKKLSVGISASSSRITSPVTLHFSRTSWVCGGDFYTSQQNSFAKDCSKSNKLQETHGKGFLCLCIPIARSYVIIHWGHQQHTSWYYFPFCKFQESPSVQWWLLHRKGLQRICWKSKQLLQLCALVH